MDAECAATLHASSVAALSPPTQTSRVTQVAVDNYRQQHNIRSPMIKVWQNFTGLEGKAATRRRPVLAHERAGYAFEAVWWIKRRDDSAPE